MLLCLALTFLASLAFFLYQIETPLKPNFDEFHYIPAAKEFLALGKNRNWEHPPFAKYWIAAGIQFFGDNPLGWRVMSTVFGAFTLSGMVFWGWVLFQSLEWAFLLGAITFFNQLLYVQSRIAMLDTFMMAFLVWALALFSYGGMQGLSNKTRTWALGLTGVALGLAMASKWFAIVAWAPVFGVWVLAYFFRWNSHARSVPFFKGVLLLGVLPFAIYQSTFLPLLLLKGENYRLLDLFTLQFTSYEGQLRVVNTHPYMSTWWQWPLLTRPIWYAFDKEGLHNEWVRGVLLVGNPIIMLGGLLALGYCLLDSLKKQSLVAIQITGYYFIFYFSWILIPRRVAFYYYYYPAGMILGVALVYYFFRRAQLHSKQAQKERLLRWSFVITCAAMFIYFYPVLSGTPIPTESFRNWMWLSSWI